MLGFCDFLILLLIPARRAMHVSYSSTVRYYGSDLNLCMGLHTKNHMTTDTRYLNDLFFIIWEYLIEDSVTFFLLSAGLLMQ